MNPHKGAIERTSASRVAAFRRRSVAAGGRQVAVHLSPEASRALAELVQAHGSVKAAVEHALLASQRRKRR